MNKYFIDCGAHCGESILTAKQRFGNDINVVSFEPVPGLAKQLQEIHQDNPTIQIQNSAVWINDDIKKFHLSEAYTDGSSLLNSLNNLRNDHYIEVNCFDLSTWLSETFTEEDYLILKLDIEGAEYEVLNKMIEELLDEGTISHTQEYPDEPYPGQHSFDEDDGSLTVGNTTVYPRSVVKKIEVLK